MFKWLECKKCKNYFNKDYQPRCKKHMENNQIKKSTPVFDEKCEKVGCNTKIENPQLGNNIIFNVNGDEYWFCEKHVEWGKGHIPQL